MTDSQLWEVRLYELNVLISAVTKKMSEIEKKLEKKQDEIIELQNELYEVEEHLERLKSSKAQMIGQSEEENYPDTGKCRHCSEELKGGYDKDDLYHCQVCHNVYDGCAQCPHY